jgi:hypothetical protein
MNVREADYEFWSLLLRNYAQMCPMTGFDVEHGGSATTVSSIYVKRLKIQVL